MMRILKVGGVTLATLLGAILLLAGTMWLSSDVRYSVAFIWPSISISTVRSAPPN
jgi:hypothetical protein